MGISRFAWVLRQVKTTPVGGSPASDKAAARFLTGLFDASTEYALIAADRGGRIVLWNEGARRLYGYGQDEIVGRPIAVLHTERDVTAGVTDGIFQRAMIHGRWRGTLRQVREDRGTFVARLAVTPHKVGGHDVGFLVVASDVTDQVEAIQELRKTRAFLSSLVESAPDAMVIVNDAGEIQLANAETVRLFGYGREELVGQPVELLMPSRFHGTHTEHRAAFFTRPKARPMGVGLELSGRRQDGTEFPVEISLSAVETEEGLLVTAAIRDVTERRRFEQDSRTPTFSSRLQTGPRTDS